MTRTVSLPQYEGPLDLLLALVRERQLDIRNLPVAEVTRQFLAYLSTAGQLDLELDSEWFYTAALLIQIKSRSLLPESPGEDSTDPREELVRQLLDREELASATGFLESHWEALGGWPVPPPPDADPDPDPESAETSGAPGSLSVFEVLDLAQQALEAVAAAGNLEIPAATVTTEEMLGVLSQQVAELPPGGRLDFSALWLAAPSDRHRTALFLALLEAARGHQLELEQRGCFAPIRIERPGRTQTSL
jgi:segregation and condensation protein A